uniref:RanBP2-type domain-containing protein n=1 Tax=Panagrolaimus superbus TaxID=310955 RepID=A0A914XYM6_9BILA
MKRKVIKKLKQYQRKPLILILRPLLLKKSQTPVAKEQLPLPITNAAGSWDCSTCMVNNAASEEKCVCCETPKEGTAGNTAPQPVFKPTEFKPVPASGIVNTFCLLYLFYYCFSFVWF